MARIRCPICGHSESDGRPHDREIYFEVCILCEPPRSHVALGLRSNLPRILTPENRSHSVKA